MQPSDPTTITWHSAQALPASLTPVQQRWLFDDGSLTRRLQGLSCNRFSVTPLHEGWQPLRDDECAALQIDPGSEGWVREVYLRGADRPWVFARSVAARSALEGSGIDLAQLGSRSLGELLFSDSAFSRGELQACIYPGAWLPPELHAPTLWARRSCFSRGELGVLVAEVFLPALWQEIADRSAKASL